jgi:hypothetical protein
MKLIALTAKSSESVHRFLQIRKAFDKAGSTTAEPTTHRLKVRPSQIALCQSNPIYPQVAIRSNLFGMGLGQPIFIYPVRELFGLLLFLLEESQFHCPKNKPENP